jgi:hypothetical protein
MANTAIIGVFDDEQKFVSAMESLKSSKINIKEAYTPYPIHDVFHLLERKTRFTYAAFIYGVAAVIGVLSFLYYTSVIDWPLNFGGKPTNAFPSFIVITIILTILSITILSLFTFSIVARIYPGKPVNMPDLRSTDDKFVMVVEKHASASAMMKENGATDVYEKEVEYL